MKLQYTYRYSRERTATTTACCAVCLHRWEPHGSRRGPAATRACVGHINQYFTLWHPIGTWLKDHEIRWRDIDEAGIQQAQDALLAPGQEMGLKDQAYE